VHGEVRKRATGTRGVRAWHQNLMGISDTTASRSQAIPPDSPYGVDLPVQGQIKLPPTGTGSAHFLVDFTAPDCALPSGGHIYSYHATIITTPLPLRFPVVAYRNQHLAAQPLLPLQGKPTSAGRKRARRFPALYQQTGESAQNERGETHQPAGE